MATIKIDKSSDSYKETKGFDPLPKGKYAVEVYSAKAGAFKSGKYEGKPKVDLQLRVLEGPFENRRIFENLLPLFERWQPKEAGKKGWPTNLGQVMVASGILEVDDEDPEAFAEELLGTRFIVDVEVRDDLNGDPRNNIRRYHEYDENAEFDSDDDSAAGTFMTED